MPLYFAYGSCMNELDLSRTVQAKTVGIARLNNYKLVFSRYSHTRKGGVADIVKVNGEYLEGVLFEVPNFIKLDAREGHPTFYKRKRVKVLIIETGDYVWAYTYEIVRKEIEEVKPSREYCLLIWEGARVLSIDYRRKLKESLLKKRKRYSLLAPSNERLFNKIGD
ncbi:gamma-glutamylcyclotransferase family protein [Metabacillus niabensis]|uniref:gamma-glutamylcyclotransferase family protein n=1 Tax=Metabacillus niabensis TaxID=324854 RepID=UPI0039A1F95A